MKRKILGFLGVVFLGALMLTTMVPAGAAYATDDDACAKSFLGFKPWHAGLDKNPDCTIKSPEKTDTEGTKLAAFIWKIVLNVVFDLSLAVGYGAVLMVIYGGYMYIMSDGDPAKAAKGQKTLTNAIAGVIIAMGATVIINTLIATLGIDRSEGVVQTFDAARWKDVLNWLYGVAGLVAVLFVIKGGANYVMSKGEPDRIRKATHGIIFALIGFLIVILASVITNFVLDKVGGAL